jgi:hypothetical protein
VAGAVRGPLKVKDVAQALAVGDDPERLNAEAIEDIGLILHYAVT